MNFDGSYYFGGTNGAPLQKSTVTDDGFIVDDTGKIVNMDDRWITEVSSLRRCCLDIREPGVFMKDLNEEKEILINDTSLYSKFDQSFVMAKTYERTWSR